jgi:hypothetical protein
VAWAAIGGGVVGGVGLRGLGGGVGWSRWRNEQMEREKHVIAQQQMYSQMQKRVRIEEVKTNARGLEASKG